MYPYKILKVVFVAIFVPVEIFLHHELGSRAPKQLLQDS
jgi:hypothetical protein